MKHLYLSLAAAASLAAPALATPVLAADKHRAFAVVNEEAGVPVLAGDVPGGRAYDVIGKVTAHVRKATVLSHASSEPKIYRELWERADKLGADAVINASYGKSHVTALSWGSTTAEGTAVKFRDH